MKRLIYLLIALFLFAGIGAAQAAKTPLTEREAAARFEQFVIANGYTDLPPTDDASKLVAEPVNGSTGEAEIASRKNTLERKPYSVTKGNRFSKDGWTATFLYVASLQNGKNLIARIVYMDANGENFRIEHQSLLIKKSSKSEKKRQR